jgi:glyoxylase-like metal-dependent hydrolase (beta-lactamase superfamily II)
VEIDFESEIFLVPLHGHTPGHCGVAVQQKDKWVFYIGDAYYLREELFVPDHPVNALAEMNSMDNKTRLETLASLKQLLIEHGDLIEMFGYHAPAEFKTADRKIDVQV